MNLADVLQHWLQGQINTCTMGLFDRIEQLERERSDTDAIIRGHARMIEQLQSRLSELEDRAVETAPDEQLEGFTDRVRDVVADYIENNDSLVTMRAFDEMVEAFINESVFKIKVR